MTYSLTGYILVPDKDLPAVLKHLPEHTRLTREEPGCLLFDVRQDPGHPDRFTVQEDFVDAEAFKHHQQRLRDTPWYQASLNVERHYWDDEGE